MDWFLVCARAVLAGVFLIAAAGKLLDRDRSAASLAGFGVPAPLIKLGSIVLPAAELLVAVGLLFASTAQAGALGALFLLAAFTAAMVLRIRRGDRFDCNCFGSLHSEPIGAAPIIRNVALGAIAATVATQGVQPAIEAWLAHRSPTDLAILSLSAALAATFGVIGVWWRRSRVLRKPALASAPPTPRAVGSRAPAIRLEDVTGRRITLKSLLREASPIALLFLSPECGSCHAVLSDLSRWQVPLARDLPIHVVSSAGRAETRAMADEHHLDRVLIDARGVVANRYGIWHRPAALIVGPDGTLASTLATGEAAIEALIRRALDQRAASRAAAHATERAADWSVSGTSSALISATPFV